MSFGSNNENMLNESQYASDNSWQYKLPYVIFLSIFFIDFAAIRLGIIPRFSTLATDAFAGIVALMAIFYLARHRSLNIDVKYIIFFFFFCLVMLFGYILNSVSAGTMLMGIRSYLRFAPFFLLPMILNLSDIQMRSQLRFLLVLALIQFPIVVLQKFVFKINPDWVAGTLNIGSVLTMFSLSAIAITFGFYLHGRLRFGAALILIICFFLPSTLNESKSIVVFLPIMVIISVMITTRTVDKKRLLVVAGLGATMLFTFIMSYAIFFGTLGVEEERENLFLVDPGKAATHYLFSDTLSDIDPRKMLDLEKRVVGQVPELVMGEDRVARLDSVLLPVVVLSQDISKLAFGLGAGNASDSFITSFSGEYEKYATLNVSIPQLPIFLWEIGLLGVGMFLMFFIFIFIDSRYLANKEGISASIATGWAAVVVMIILSLPYKPFMLFSVLGVLFWYFSGYIATKCYLDKRGINT